MHSAAKTLVEPEEDLFDVYFDMLDDTSESPFLYHRWTLISSIAALLGRQASFPLGHDIIYPNMYVCLMGNAGSRKSSAINVTKKLLAGTGYNTFAREKSSSQKFIKDLGEGFDSIKSKGKPKNNVDSLEAELELLEVTNGEYDYTNEEPSEVYITAGELEDFLGANDAGFLSLLTNLWDNVDHYSHGKMTSEDIYIHEPTINLIGGTTPTTFATVFPPEVIGQGMLSRMLLVYGGGARRKITMPPAPDPKLLTFFNQHLTAIKNEIKGEFTFTKGAYKVFDAVYQTKLDLQDNRLESYINRRHVHFYKLCMVLAACELTMEITESIAIKANTILHWTEKLMPKALGAFGRAVNSGDSQVILDALDSFPKGATNVELFIKIGQDFKDMQAFQSCLQDLKSKDQIYFEGLLLFKQTKVTKPCLPFVEFSLLREYKEFNQSK